MPLTKVASPNAAASDERTKPLTTAIESTR